VCVRERGGGGSCSIDGTYLHLRTGRDEFLARYPGFLNHSDARAARIFCAKKHYDEETRENEIRHTQNFARTTRKLVVVHGIIGCAWYHWLYRWSILNDLVSTGVASSSACNAQVSPPGGNGTGTPHAAANLLSKLSFAGPHTPTTTWNTIKDSRKFYARSRV
jgi:hypothetical protein